MSKIKEAFHEEISAMPVPPRPAGKLPPRPLRPMKEVEEFFNAIGKAAGE